MYKYSNTQILYYVMYIYIYVCMYACIYIYIKKFIYIYIYIASQPGIADAELRQLAKCGRSKQNECRALHRLMHRQGRTIPVRVSTVSTPVRIPGQRAKSTVNFPVLFLSSWCQQVFSDDRAARGKMLLGGFSLDEEDKYRPMFSEFWSRFWFFRPDLDVYKQSFDRSLCIPIALHGDEGRGKLRRPVMIISYQPLISYKGPDYTNLSGSLV